MWADEPGLYSGSLTLCSHPRQSMSSLSGPLQVVPDIDDQVANPENPQEVGFPASLPTKLLFCAAAPSPSIMEGVCSSLRPPCC